MNYMELPDGLQLDPQSPAYKLSRLNVVFESGDARLEQQAERDAYWAGIREKEASAAKAISDAKQKAETLAGYGIDASAPPLTGETGKEYYDTEYGQIPAAAMTGPYADLFRQMFTGSLEGQAAPQDSIKQPWQGATSRALRESPISRQAISQPSAPAQKAAPIQQMAAPPNLSGGPQGGMGMQRPPMQQPSGPNPMRPQAPTQAPQAGPPQGAPAGLQFGNATPMANALRFGGNTGGQNG